ncbi:hypothetical protein GYMLUDRAFT_241398 [Collybiopsis luxurians FD-317 M1]|uniref:F-box domain-containing protein n=1 Tax=Collybiopsis luxurians FD-317 M1 TaxID=944289 RepID=A0A0D0CWI3_9AGAR|nr:hypothetical protein GYMLUDRAFT_241398 [Collybiopsis luxurians FD-317 M1]
MASFLVSVSAGSSLPQEVVDAITDLVQAQFSTLRALSRVSKAFLPRCRRYMFASVFLCPDTVNFFSKSPHLISFIRHLLVEGRSFHYSKLSSEELAATCTFLRNLPTLSLSSFTDDLLAEKFLSTISFKKRTVTRKLWGLLPGTTTREPPVQVLETVLYHLAHFLDAHTIELAHSYFGGNNLHAFLRTFPTLSSVRLRNAQIVKFDSPSGPSLPIQEFHINSRLSPVLLVFDVSQMKSLSLMPTSASPFGFDGAKSIIEGCASTLRELCISLAVLKPLHVTQFCSDIGLSSFPKLDTVVLSMDAGIAANFSGLCIMLHNLSSLSSQLHTLRFNLVADVQSSLPSNPQGVVLADVENMYANHNYMALRWGSVCEVLEQTGILSDLTKTIGVSLELRVAKGIRRKDWELLLDLVEYAYSHLPSEFRNRANFEYRWYFTFDFN